MSFSSVKTPHFFPIISRLGLQFPPIGSSALNLGVEQGGVEILTPDFTFEFDHLNITKLLTPSPDEISSANYFTQAAEIYHGNAQFIAKNISDDQIQIVLGGDHSVSYASMLALSARYDMSTVGVIMIDSHADLNLIATSPTGNMHGMWLRMCMEDFDDQYIRSLMPAPVRPEHVMYIGNVLLDPEEVRYITAHEMTIIDSDALRHASASTRLEKFLQAHQHIHLSVDIDVFATSIAPATGTSNPAGMQRAEVFPLLESIAASESVSIDLVEVNPSKAGSTQTLELARDVLRVLLRKQLNYPLTSM